MYRVKDEVIDGKTKQENIEKAKELADEIGRSVPTLAGFACGMCALDLRKPDYYDIALNCQFADRDALEAYRKHPAHVSFSQFMRTCTQDRASIDYYE